MVTITGTSGPDYFANDPADDTFAGSAGDDILVVGAGTGSDVFIGGDGTDQVQLVSATWPQGLALPLIAWAADTVLPSTFHLQEMQLTDGTVVRGSDGQPGWETVYVERFDPLHAAWPAAYAVLDWRTPSGATANDDFIAGSHDAEQIAAGAGDDIVFANGGADTVAGGDGNDYLSAGHEDVAAADVFDGGAGIDAVAYGAASGVSIDLAQGLAQGAGIGTDQLIGIEIAIGSMGADQIAGTGVADTLFGVGGDDVLQGRDGDDSVYGDAGNDTLAGDAGADVLIAGDGNDYGYGGFGNDTILGGAGVDVLAGEAGDDSLHGGDDPDYLYGGVGNDVLDGGAGQFDVLIGEAGNDTLRGAAMITYFYFGEGDDSGIGGAGNDIFVAEAGNDVARGGGGQDYLYMGEGNDSLDGGPGVDVLLGEAGDDTLDGGLGVGYLYLGPGADTVLVDISPVVPEPGLDPRNIVVVDDFVPGAGSGDRLQFINTEWTSLSDVLANTWTDGSALSIIVLDDDTQVWLKGVMPQQLTADDVAFHRSGTINGSALADEFLNDEGDFAYIGNAGDDVLHFGAASGNDSFSGGDGSDTLQIDASLFDIRSITFLTLGSFVGVEYRITLLDGSSVRGSTLFDSVWERVRVDGGADLTWMVQDAQENFIAGADLAGGDGNDVLFGSGLLHGDAGDDYLSTGSGNAGNDTFDGGAGVDTVSYSGAGAVTLDLAAGVAWGDGLGVDTLVGIERAAGSAFNDVVLGDDAGNTQWGRAGDDVIVGLGGDDVIHGDAGNDSLYGGSGSDALHGGDGIDVLIGEAGNDSGTGGDGQDYFYMGEGDDAMAGGAGVDVLLGETGNDTFDGGLDVDYLFLGPGGSGDNDTVRVDGAQSGPQVIYGFEAGGTNDVIRFGNTAFRSFADVQAAISDFSVNGYSIITVDADTNVWLIGVQPSQLTASDFLFA